MMHHYSASSPASSSSTLLLASDCTFTGPHPSLHYHTKTSRSSLSLHFFLKANLIRINYVGHGLQGFKRHLFNLIFFFFLNHEPVSNLHAKVVAYYQISGHERFSVHVRAYVSLCSRTRAPLNCLHYVWWRSDSVITPAVSEWQSLWVLWCQLTPGSDPDWQSHSGVLQPGQEVATLHCGHHATNLTRLFQVTDPHRSWLIGSK